MPGEKRKLDNKSISEKYAAIKEVEKGKRKSRVAAEFGIPHNTLSGWMKQKEKILSACDSNYFELGRKKMRLSNHPDVDEAVFRWLKQARTKNLPVTGPMLQAKAQSYASMLKADNFTASDGWLKGFKTRHGLTFESVCGEDNAVVTAVTDYEPKKEDKGHKEEPCHRDAASYDENTVDDNDELLVPEDNVQVDDNLLTCEDKTDEDIVAGILHKAEEIDDEEEEDSQEIAQDTAPPTAADAKAACDVLRRFFESHPGMSSIFTHIARLERLVGKVSTTKMQQVTLLNLLKDA